MLRRSRGSILVVTVVVFLLVNIIAINCSALIFSNTKYTTYDYKEIYIKEQCLSKIELVYSNILKEVEKALKESYNFESFETYFTSNNSIDFINKISNISGVSLKDTTCKIKRVNLSGENCIYYEIKSEVTYEKFNKCMLAYIKIENPFSKNQDNEKDQVELKEEQNEELTQEETQIQDSEEEELNQFNIDEKKVEVDKELENKDSEDSKEKIEFEENKSTNEIENTKDIKPSDLVTLFDYKEV